MEHIVFIYPSVCPSHEYEGKYLYDMLRRTAVDSRVFRVLKSYFLGLELRL